MKSLSIKNSGSIRYSSVKLVNLIDVDIKKLSIIMLVVKNLVFFMLSMMMLRFI